MAYVPPHKRHSASAPKPTPTPSHLYSKFNKTLNLKPSKSNSKHGFNIIYANDSISRWFIAGSSNHDSIHLEPFDEKSSIIIKCENDSGEESTVMPWVNIVERIMPDLIRSYNSAFDRFVMEEGAVKIAFVEKLGRVLFHENPVNLEYLKMVSDSETDSRKQVRKTFDTNVSSAQIEELENVILPKLGFELDSEKERYHVKVFDESRPESIPSYKCILTDGGTLEIRKVDLNPVRHLVADISCLYKDVDLRLMLTTKKTVTSQDDEENESINKLLESAIVDPEVKGGLRWPLGKESVANRFSVYGVWHTKCKAFKNGKIRIKTRYADRFYHKSSTGEVTNEATMKFTGISNRLMAGDVEESLIKEMVEDAVKFIWVHFLNCSHPST